MTPNSRITVALLALATLTVMSTMIIAPAVADIARAFEGTPNAAAYSKLLLTTPAAAMVLFAPVAGWLIDRYGRMRLLLWALVVYGAAGTAGLYLDDLRALVASRFVLGMAIAGTMTTMTTLAGDYFQGEARARFSGLQSVVMSAGAVVAVLFAGLLAEIHWRFAFLPYGFAWLLIVPVLAWLVEPPRASAPSTAAKAVPHDMRAIFAVYAVTTFAVAMFYVTHAQTPFLLRSLGNQSPTLVGVALALSSLLAAISAGLYMRVRRRVGFVGTYSAAFAVMAVGYVSVAIAPNLGSFTTAYAVILLGMVISGIGVGLFYPNSSLGILNLAPPAIRGRVAGGLSASVCLGQFVSPIALEPAVATVGVAGAFGIAATLLAMAAVGCGVLQRQRGRQ